MKVREIMTTDVECVAPDTGARVSKQDEDIGCRIISKVEEGESGKRLKDISEAA